MTPNSALKFDKNQSISLRPLHRLPLIIITFGIVLFPFPWSPWPSIVISSFGLFLLIQSFILRIEFTRDDLVVWQIDRELRRFPFKNWLAWRLLLPELPGLFYFREKASPHLLPILFDPKELENQLRLRVGHLEAEASKDQSSTS